MMISSFHYNLCLFVICKNRRTITWLAQYFVNYTYCLKKINSITSTSRIHYPYCTSVLNFISNKGMLKVEFKLLNVWWHLHTNMHMYKGYIEIHNNDCSLLNEMMDMKFKEMHACLFVFSVSTQHKTTGGLKCFASL